MLFKYRENRTDKSYFTTVKISLGTVFSKAMIYRFSSDYKNTIMFMDPGVHLMGANFPTV